MIKLKNAEGKYQWVYGTTGLNYSNAAKKATNKTRMCKTVNNAIKACAYAYLDATLMAGYNTLYSVESGNGYDRKDVIVNIALPACITDAVKIIEDTCRQYGARF
jgi:hypothetical protein